MYKAEDIFARLQKGEDIATIAKEMQDALNTATKMQKDEEEKRQREEMQKADRYNLSEMLWAYLDEYYPELLEMVDCDSEEAINTILDDYLNTLEKFLTKFSGLADSLFSVFDSPLQEGCNKSGHKEGCKCESKKSDSDIISEFFRINGI